jgi:cytochrome c5
MRYLLTLLALAPLMQACTQPPDPPQTAAPLPATEPGTDAATGLVMTGDWELVRNNCVACHSARLITQQRGTAEQWLAMIRWMQQKQNLWQFDPDTEARIIAYLAENYAPEASRRRALLSPDLMPPNPYARELP